LDYPLSYFSDGSINCKKIKLLQYIVVHFYLMGRFAYDLHDQGAHHARKLEHYLIVQNLKLDKETMMRKQGSNILPDVITL
jgi:hypothetical protein